MLRTALLVVAVVAAATVVLAQDGADKVGGLVNQKYVARYKTQADFAVSKISEIEGTKIRLVRILKVQTQVMNL